MKKLFGIFLLSVALSTTTQAQSREEKAVAAAVQELKKAMLSGNKAQLEKIAADELSYGHSSGTIEDKAAFVDALVSGRNDFETIELTDETIKVIGNTAI